MGMADDDAELDYDDPSFLASAAAAVPPPTTSDLSYAQRRRKQRLDSERKQVDHALRQQRTGRAAETERREEGLATSLIDLQVQQAATAGGAGEGNALKMMRMMGFTPGESLGKRSSVGSSIEGGEPAATASRTEPLSFAIRSGRKGLGNNEAAPPFKKVRLSASTTRSAAAPALDVDNYRMSSRSSYADRHAQSILRSARKTVEELDRRHGIEYNLMWLGELGDAAKDEREARVRRAGIRTAALDAGEDEGDVEDESAALRKQVGLLGYEQGLSNVVVDDGSDAEDEGSAAVAGSWDAEEDWLALDVMTRLSATLGYLRTSYSYCFYCGTAYQDLSELTLECPGELEEDH